MERSELLELILEAKRIGLTVEEVQDFIDQHRKGNTEEES